jgi:hypothetical protein
MKSLIAGTALALATSSFGFARSEAGTLAQNCAYNPCVYDARGRIVGMSVGITDLVRLISGQWYQLQFDSAGLYTETEVYYISSNCTGARYFNVGYVKPGTTEFAVYLPQWGAYDGSVIWTPVGKPAEVQVNSESFIDGSNCQTWSGTGPTIVAQPGAAIDATTFYPPFSLR